MTSPTRTASQPHLQVAFTSVYKTRNNYYSSSWLTSLTISTTQEADVTARGKGKHGAPQGIAYDNARVCVMAQLVVGRVELVRDGDRNVRGG